MMKYTLFLLFFFFSFHAYNQENEFEKNFKVIQDKLLSTDQPGLKIRFYKDIINLSFPDHLDYVRKYSEELLSLSESINNTDSKAFSFFMLGRYYNIKDEYENANKYYKLALEEYQELENKNQIAEINYYLGLTNQYLNHYDDALTYYQKSLDFFESIGNKEKTALNYHDIGTLYNDLQKYSLAQFYYEKALAIYIELNDVERVAAIYQNIGVLYYNWGDYEKSLEFYKKSLKTYEDLKDKQNIGISLSNIGLVYEETKDFDKALEYYQNALIIFEEMNFKPTLVYIFYNMGSIYRNIKNYTKSIEYFEKGLKLSKEISTKDYISYNYEALAGVYEDLGQNKKALQYYKNYIEIKDSLFNEEKFKQIEQIEVQFQNAQHQKEIELLKLDQELKESKIKKKEAQNLILIFSSVLTFIIAVILYLFNQSHRKSSKKLKMEIEERKNTEEQLNKIKSELELRVKERTADIELTNTKLKDEIEEHKVTLQNLEIAKNRAEEADRLKSNFLANMSHEIRTPMNAITGFSQMLAYDHLTPQKKNNYIRLIQDSCKSLTNLIDDIIDFATIDSGDVKIEKKDFNPHPILEFIFDHFTNELVKKGNESLILSYANENKENDILINTDPARLKQIMTILIDNAIKFTENGHVEFGFIHPNENEIQFFVRDTGIGIDEKYKDLIFERFRQIDESTTKKYGGAGIGLSVAKSISELMGGKIWFESTLGKGTTFYFQIPHKLDGEIPLFIQPKNFNWNNKVILVAEDKKINFDIIKETLSVTNADLIWAKNGVEALDIIKAQNKIDLILMDIQMPIMDGYETARRIKEIVSDIPIIAQTAYALPQDSYKCIDAGCDDYIAKPISLDQFLVKLNKYLS